MDITSFLIGLQKGKASAAAGTHPDVRYVTFMNGEEVLYVKPVATGDDCVDVLTKGLISTPTKASTDAEVFTYSGWARTDGGDADASALTAVTENRTVYAAYTSEARYYTITYYDSDGVTVMNTESLAYGATPTYKPEKDGFNFDGWVPALATVTGNASYTAQFSEKLTFAGASWADIARISEAGEAPNMFKIGDTRLETYTNTDGTTETIKLRLVGFNHDDLADGSGKAGMTVLCVGVPSEKVPWTTTYVSSAYSMIYEKKYGIRVQQVKSKLTSELQSVMKNVVKKTDAAFTSGTSPTLNEVAYFVWAPSVDELGYTGSAQYCSTLGEKYEGMTAKEVIYVGTSSTKADCWTRTHSRQGVSNVYKVYNYNNVDYTFGMETLQSQANVESKLNHICFGFCI